MECIPDYYIFRQYEYQVRYRISWLTNLQDDYLEASYNQQFQSDCTHDEVFNKEPRRGSNYCRNENESNNRYLVEVQLFW